MLDGFWGVWVRERERNFVRNWGARSRWERVFLPYGPKARKEETNFCS